MIGAASVSPLIEPGAAFEALRAGHTFLVDASWTLDPNASAYAGPSLPGAVRFDLDAVCDDASDLPHMAPSRVRLAQWAEDAGVIWGAPIIIYDNDGLFSAPRVWWTFRHCGWAAARVMNGGLPAWIAGGLPLEDPGVALFGAATPAEDEGCDAFEVASLDDVKAAVRDGFPRLLDARGADRFSGAAPEPRPGLRSGAMPGAVNIPYTELIASDGRLRSVRELERIFEDHGLGERDEVIATCGSGVTAAIIILALEVSGRRAHRLYDGSWAEWGAPDPDGTRPLGRSDQIKDGRTRR